MSERKTSLLSEMLIIIRWVAVNTSLGFESGLIYFRES